MIKFKGVELKQHKNINWRTKEEKDSGRLTCFTDHNIWLRYSKKRGLYLISGSVDSTETVRNPNNTYATIKTHEDVRFYSTLEELDKYYNMPVNLPASVCGTKLYSQCGCLGVYCHTDGDIKIDLHPHKTIVTIEMYGRKKTRTMKVFNETKVQSMIDIMKVVIL